MSDENPNLLHYSFITLQQFVISYGCLEVEGKQAKSHLRPNMAASFHHPTLLRQWTCLCSSKQTNKKQNRFRYSEEGVLRIFHIL